MITCGDCGIQYVGQTIQFLHIRLNGHRSSTKNSLNTYVYQHFNSHGHDFTKIKIQIIDILDPKIYDKHDLDTLENFWINTLETAYPFGLNDKVKGTGNISKNKYFNENLTCYFSSHTKRCRRSHGISKKNKKLDINYEAYNHGSVDNNINQLSYLIKNQINKFYIKVKSYGKKIIKLILNDLADRDIPMHNIITSYLNNRQKINEIAKKAEEREHIILSFNCKFIDKLCFNSILRDTSIESLLPKPIADKLPLKIYYKYNKPIGKELLNYNSFLNNLKNYDIKEIVDSDCECSTSPYKDEFHQHVITGNLNIVSNVELKDIMSLGVKYREPNFLKPNIIRNSINKNINNFIESKSKKYNIKIKDFDQWRNRITDIINKRISFYEVKKPQVFNGTNSIMKMQSSKDYIKELQQKYILVVADKAANNFVLICKKFYVLTMMKELGIETVSFNCIGNITYQKEEKTENELIQEHTNILRDEFKLTCNKKDQIIPKIFWNAKLHKTPSKARFISGARHCTLKELSVKINKALQVIKANFGKYCDTIQKHTGINFNWSISSSYEFLEKIKSKEIWSMQVYDFTTLYTSLNLNEVEKSLFSLIDLVFSNKNKYICIGYNKSFFAKKKYKGYYTFDSKSLKDAVKFIIYNTYIKFGEYILKQTKGIPMGGNCSSPMADLTLGFREFSYMKELLKNKKFSLARLLSNNSRYVDDINIINYKNFNNIIADIYPPDLKVERNGENDKEVNYLDIKIIISGNGVTTNVFNKTEEFNFPVVSFTYPTSNIPMQLGYNVFYGQILRYSKICSKRDNFLIKTKHLYNILQNRGYKENKLLQFFKKIYIKNHFNLFKFGYVNIMQIVNDLKLLI